MKVKNSKITSPNNTSTHVAFILLSTLRAKTKIYIKKIDFAKTCPFFFIRRPEIINYANTFYKNKSYYMR